MRIMDAGQRAVFGGARAGTGRGARVIAAGVALVLGVLLIFGIGFAEPAALHNAAHDARHVLSFPCH